MNRITLNPGNQIVVEFEGVLEMAPTPDGPFAAVAGAVSPFTLQPGGSLAVFRAREGEVVTDKLLGYLRLNLPNGLSLVANPFRNEDSNMVVDLFTAAGVPDGFVVGRFDGSSNVTISRVGGDWEGDDLGMTLAPGEGVFVQTAGAIGVAFVGLVLKTPAHPMPSDGFRYVGNPYLHSSTFSEATGTKPGEGLTVRRLLSGDASYLIDSFVDGAWEGDSGGAEPVLQIGESALIEGPTLSALVITLAPVSLAAALGETVRFLAGATGAEPLRFLWFGPADQPLIGETKPELIRPALSVADAGSYFLRVTDATGAKITTSPVTLRVDAPLQFLSPLTATTTNATTTFTAAAVGDGPLTFQWRLNGRVIPGQTSSSLVVTRGDPATAGTYQLVISDGHGALQSSPLRVPLELPPLPFSDAFAARPDSGSPFTNEIAGVQGSGANFVVEATAEPGEPPVTHLPPAHSLWLTWRPDVDGIAALDTLGSSADTRLAVYTNRAPTLEGAALNQLGLVAANDNVPGRDASPARVEFNCQAGVTYFISVDFLGALPNKGEDAHQLVLVWQAEATAEKLPEIAAQPADAAARRGEAVTLSVAAATDPTATVSVQWFRVGSSVPLAGETGLTLSLNPLTLDRLGGYYARVEQTFPGGTTRTTLTEAAEVQVYETNDPLPRPVLARDTLARIRADLAVGPGAARQAAANLRRQGLARGISTTQIFNTTGATTDGGERLLCDQPAGSTMLTPILPTADGVVEVDTEGTPFSSTFTVYYDSGFGNGPFDGLEEMACDYSNSPGHPVARARFCARAGLIYTVAAAGLGGQTGPVTVNYRMLDLDPATNCQPVITFPTGLGQVVAAAGSQLGLHAQATGLAPLAYQWFRDDLPLTGETSASLEFSPVSAGMTGQYSLVVTNVHGLARAVVAGLRVTGATDELLLGYEPLAGGGLRFVLAGQPGRACTLEDSTDGATWRVVLNGTLSPAGRAEFPVLHPELDRVRLFRGRGQ